MWIELSMVAGWKGEVLMFEMFERHCGGILPQRSFVDKSEAIGSQSW